ncbi:MAG: ABC transporter permease [Oscillospiraceae bacterium]|nr:ABC transporter permease [Oscillospiraceae bacterium]
MISFIFSENFLTSSISYALPIIFAAFAALISNKANIVSINIEGSMSVAALSGALVSYYTQSWAIGLLAAIAAGVGMSLLLALSAIKLKTDTFLSGIALNTFASGLCVLVLYLVLGVKGDSSMTPSVLIPQVKIPLLSEIPVIGPSLFAQNLLFYVAVISLFALMFLLYRTRLGTKIRATGYNPEATASVGIKTGRVQTVSLVFCGVFCGLGGAYLSMANLGYFSAGMVSGRGFIGIAAEAMGAGKPVLTMLFSLLFGAVDYFAVGGQTVMSAPYELLNTLPYIMTLAALLIYSLAKKKHIQT